MYDELAVTSSELIAEFGTPITLTSQGAGTYDPATGTVSGTGQTITGQGVKTEYLAHEIDGTVIQAGDAKVLIAPDIAQPPQIGDTLTIAGEVYRVMNVDTLKPASTVLLYTVQGRR